jgi:ankyrin repeat protein
MEARVHRLFRDLLVAGTVLTIVGLAESGSRAGEAKRSTVALNLAVAQNDVATVKQLIAAGDPLTPRAGGAKSIIGEPNPLDTAASGDFLEIARLLIAHGADVNRQGKQWGTPLWTAVGSTITKDRFQSAGVLIENGAEINVKRMGESVAPVTVREKTAEGEWKTTTEMAGGCHTTPLHEAVFALDTDVAELLIRKGANLSITDVEGLTPLQCAQRRLTQLRAPHWRQRSRP